MKPLGRNLAAVDGWGVAWSGKGTFSKRCSPPKVAFGSDWGGTFRCRSSIGSGSISPRHFVLFFDLPLTLSFVGEMRLFETTEIVVSAVLTAHLVLRTLHTNDAPGTMPRLLNVGIAISRRDFAARDLRATVAGTRDGLDCTKLWK